jgi:fatty-acyl-CoA synthase
MCRDNVDTTRTGRDPAWSANDYVALHARQRPAAPAVHDLISGRRWTYQSLDHAISQYAALLRSHGIETGDRVAVLAKNRAELTFLHLACARIGAMYVPLNWRLSAAEIGQLIEDATPRLLLGDAMLERMQLNGLSLEEFASAANDLDPLAVEATDQNAPSLILYTSGTSGLPKGVLLSEHNIWQTAHNFSLLARVTHDSAFLCESPMFHIIGLITSVRPALMRGGRIVVSDGFMPARTLALLSDPALGVTHYFCVPQMAALLRAEPSFDAKKLRGLTAVFSGGAPHGAAAIRAWTDQGIPMADGYGMSEAGTVSCMPLDIDQINAHAGSAGLIAPQVHVRILDERGEQCPAGEAGDIVVKGANVTRGYWRRPEESRAAFIDDGWLRTGDVGRMDGDGFLWLIDRKKDMFISGGENVYPAEIERLLAGHPHILECAVVGVADERWGEVGHLVIVQAPNLQIDPAEIVAFLEARLARFKIPKHITLADKLPRNGAGKLDKNTLRAMTRTQFAPQA